MDCEKFDKVALEMLYDELDELTSAAAKRHMDHCSRCGRMGARMRATREVGVLPAMTPPAGLEQRILKLERQARRGLPVRERIGRAISVLAGYAMRPQLAMAALCLLMIGSSFLFLRAKPGDADSVRVTERGIREADESVAIVPLPEQPEPAPVTAPPVAPAAEAKRAPATENPKAAAAEAAVARAREATEPQAAEANENNAYETAMSAYRRGEYTVAREQFEAIAAEGGEQAPSAHLFAAHATRSSVGCTQAAAKFDVVNQQFPGTNVAEEATWQAASCYRSLGQTDLARKRYQRLLDAPAYADRAQHALARLDRQEAEMVATRKATAKPPAKPAAKTKASKQATPSSQGFGK